MRTRFTAPVVLPCDERCSVLRDAVVDVGDDGRIAYVGSAVHAPAEPDVTHRRSGILLPGLINAHAHTAMTALRGLGGDELPLLRWLTEVIWPAEGRLQAADAAAGVLAGCLEMLRAGVTTSVEMYFYTDAVIESVLAAGSRAVVTPGIIAVPGWDRLGSWQQMLDDISARIDSDGLCSGPGERIEVGYGPHAAYTLPAEALAAAAAAAQPRGALLATHVAESVGEDAELRAEHGSVPLLLEKLGVLREGARVLAAHAVQLSDADIAVLARHGAGVAHCPGSNAKLASGVARLLDLHAAGIPVGLGTDGPASHDDLDLWTDVRLAAQLARLHAGDAAALTAAQALLLATRDGATAIGRDDLGTLRAGAWADLVHVGVDGPAFAGGLDVPDGRLLSNLVWGGGARSVVDVWVAAEQVIEDGAPTRADPVQADAQLRAAVGRVAS